MVVRRFELRRIFKFTLIGLSGVFVNRALLWLLASHQVFPFLLQIDTPDSLTLHRGEIPAKTIYFFHYHQLTELHPFPYGLLPRANEQK